MDFVVGGASGLVAGALGAIIAAIVQITAKRFRNAALARRGEPAYKDVTLIPTWIPVAGVIGLVAGALATGLTGGTWRTGALAGLVVPALLTLLFVGNCVVQARR